ncbi:MAG: hypothetical protein ACODAD_12275 [Planctomycetota bacterium]
MNGANGHKLPDTLDSASREFILWLLGALGLHVHARGHGVYEIAVPDEPGDAVSAAAHRHAAVNGWRFTFDKNLAEETDSFDPGEHVTWRSPLARWLLDELRQMDGPLHAAAAKQPLSVRELAEHLFAQYTVDNGHMHLAGCSLEDRPFLRLSYLRSAPAEGKARLVHCYGNSEGELVDAELRESLGLNNVVPLGKRTPRIDATLVRNWTQVTRGEFEDLEVDPASCLIAVTVVWCKHAEGKLAFSIGQASAEVCFSEWGRLLVDRRCFPPPYECPLSDRSSYHLAATDDGHITVAEAIARCAESSQKVVENELRTCAVTHARVLPEYLRECPCTGMQVRSSVLETCSLCQQRVSPRAIVNTRCSACRELAAISNAHPQLARLLSRYPKLRKFGRWRMAESRTVWIFLGRAAWKKILVVVHKQRLDVLHMAISNRWSRTWTPMTETQRADWLGERAAASTSTGTNSPVSPAP